MINLMRDGSAPAGLTSVIRQAVLAMKPRSESA